ncbi:MAG: hypothetical protein HUJ11_05940, partial [Arenibacter algicola]|nr:hypothetical protein [Arenibacter algicola]
MGSDNGKTDGGSDKLRPSEQAKRASGPNVFDNFAEDLGSIFDGTANSPHSAYDVRNAEAMKDKAGRSEKDYLPGGKYGPGGERYSPATLHEAGRTRTRAMAARNRAGFLDGRVPDHASGSGAPGGTVHHLGGSARLQTALSVRGPLDEDAVTGHPGSVLLDATKDLQKANGLTIDDQSHPGGSTGRTLSKRLLPQTASTVLSGAVRGAGSKRDQQLNAAKMEMARGGETKEDQARNIARYRDLQEKHADAIAKANEAAARARKTSWDFIGQQTDLKAPQTFTSEQRRDALHAKKVPAQAGP